MVHAYSRICSSSPEEGKLTYATTWVNLEMVALSEPRCCKCSTHAKPTLSHRNRMVFAGGGARGKGLAYGHRLTVFARGKHP